MQQESLQIALVYFLSFGWAGSLLLRGGLLQLWLTGCSCRLLQCTGFPLQCTGFPSQRLLWWSTSSRVGGIQELQCLAQQLWFMGPRAHVAPIIQLLHGMLYLPGPWRAPLSPELAGGFLCAVPPGKSQSCFKYQIFLTRFNYWIYKILIQIDTSKNIIFKLKYIYTSHIYLSTPPNLKMPGLELLEREG